MQRLRAWPLEGTYCPLHGWCPPQTVGTCSYSSDMNETRKTCRWAMHEHDSPSRVGGCETTAGVWFVGRSSIALIRKARARTLESARPSTKLKP